MKVRSVRPVRESGGLREWFALIGARFRTEALHHGCAMKLSTTEDTEDTEGEYLSLLCVLRVLRGGEFDFGIIRHAL